MTYTTVPFNPAGASYQSRSKPLSSQQTINWIPQFNEQGKEQFVLMPFPGLKQTGSFNTPLTNRGMWRMAERQYQVKGQSLYRISASGAHTLLGDIPGNQRCIFADDGINLVIVTELKTYVYSTDTGDITTPTGTGVTGAKSVGIINNQYLFTFDAVTFVASIDNSTKEFTTDGQIGAESKPDGLVRDYVFDERVYRFGERTCEPWYNNPTVIPPISRLDGQILEVGCAAIYSIAHNDEYLYWLGDDHSIYRTRSGVKERVSSDAISTILSNAGDLTGCFAYTFTEQAQNFYMITIPNVNMTFVFNEKLGSNGWFQLSSGLGGKEYQGSSVLNVYGVNSVADASNGKIYTLDINTFTNDGEPIKRTRVTKSINGDMGNMKGKRLMMNEIKFIMETGVGLISGQGEDPRIILELSFDGGKTWPHVSWPRVGRLGENTLQVEAYVLKSFYDCILRITATDPVSYSLYSGTVSIKSYGK
ncbi:MAG: hypothetical protein K0U20_08375 [Proteobacteria bacterium]|nr:hypothetical protein [Pseudomonadota bacterium]